MVASRQHADYGAIDANRFPLGQSLTSGMSCSPQARTWFRRVKLRSAYYVSDLATDISQRGHTVAQFAQRLDLCCWKN
jgi:hypothetical protein